MYHYFIVNPHSKSGRAAFIWKSIEPSLTNSHIEYKAVFTTHCGHAVQLIRQFCKTHPGRKMIVIVGGDGTINEVINGLPTFKDVTIGYIPTGSGNDLARGLNISRKPHEALLSICHPKKYTYTDIGLLTMLSKDGSTQRKFAVSSGIGYDADVCRHVIKSRLKNILNKMRLGKLTYLLIGICQLISHRPTDGTIIIDQVNQINLNDIFFVSFMIHKSEGGGLKMAPDADYEDGLLNVCIVSGINKLKLFCTVPALFLGKHEKMKGIQIIKCRQAEIITKRPLAVHTDGEVNGNRNHIKLSVMSEPLRFLI